MRANSNLERVLASGKFAVTAEIGPPRSASADLVRKRAEEMRGSADAFNLTDNQTAMSRMSSIACAVVLIQQGLEPVVQMTCRDRNRIAMQSDILGASALGVRNVLCLSGDHQVFGNMKEAK
ncbi:MAG: methylenetetrahydrofolate reductase, partial [Methanomassiliicoccales archaeon]|nr:methylenetetrahydrofolate reductase [Methanomassiliicoccales archaeon]